MNKNYLILSDMKLKIISSQIIAKKLVKIQYNIILQKKKKKQKL